MLWLNQLQPRPRNTPAAARCVCSLRHLRREAERRFFTSDSIREPLVGTPPKPTAHVWWVSGEDYRDLILGRVVWWVTSCVWEQSEQPEVNKNRWRQWPSSFGGWQIKIRREEFSGQVTLWLHEKVDVALSLCGKWHCYTNMSAQRYAVWDF